MYILFTKKEEIKEFQPSVKVDLAIVCKLDMVEFCYLKKIPIRSFWAYKMALKKYLEI